MAAKNSLKIYSENGYYHIYNRGVEKRSIFLDEQDYAVFLTYLKEYLLPKDEEELNRRFSDPLTSYQEKNKIMRLLRLNNFNGEIILLAYCLMPNHFHLLIKQKSENSIDKFMNSLGVRYVIYFNHKYQRIGSLFQGVYKAVMVESDTQLLYLSNYIHRNPIKKNRIKKLATPDEVWRGYFSQPSSLPEYLEQRESEWVHPEEILGFFSKTDPKNSYQSFVQQNDESSLIEPITDLVIDI